MFPSLFISHGSPTLALEPGESGPALAQLAASLPRPRAIVMVSAHWESHELIVNGNPQPETWHDFGGFAAELFAMQYPAPGLPELTRTIVELLAANGLPARIDSRRPFDHGVWVPLSLMYPQADIPVVQVSLPSRQGPALQTQVGRALAGLREQGVLIIGSGSITHNLYDLDWSAGPDSVERWAVEFRDWMIDKLQCNDETALHTTARWRLMRCGHTPVTNTCCRFISHGAQAARSASLIRALPWAHWAWTSIGSTDTPTASLNSTQKNPRTSRQCCSLKDC